MQGRRRRHEHPRSDSGQLLLKFSFQWDRESATPKDVEFKNVLGRLVSATSSMPCGKLDGTKQHRHICSKLRVAHILDVRVYKQSSSSPKCRSPPQSAHPFTTPSSNMTSFPPPATYAVVEVDLKSTVATLDDPIATAVTATVQTTKCIVYLDAVRPPRAYSP